MSKLCYKCFSEYVRGDICPHCGYRYSEKERELYPLALQPGTILGGRYILGRVLSQGGFGITYAAQDYETKQIVAIKEFFPEAIVTRVDTHTVATFSQRNDEAFKAGKEKFLAEAQTLSRFNGLGGICDIYSYFEENGTAYFAMEYVEGKTLEKHVKDSRNLAFVDAKDIFLPLMETLDAVHAQGVVHRDIAPDNIIVRRDGSAVLIDFGAARYSAGEKSQNITVMLKYGFSPREQYSRRSTQGPYTDVYAMAATIYYALTGEVPPDAIERVEKDNLEHLGNGYFDFSEPDKVLMKGLAINAPDRWQSMRILMDNLRR